MWAGREQVDFRQVLPDVAGGLRALDPGDPRARRLPSGVVLTADGREAELATPPVRWEASAPGALDAMLASERGVLALRVAEVAGADRITGFSTHVNLSVPDDRVVDVARRFALHCALATASSRSRRRARDCSSGRDGAGSRSAASTPRARTWSPW